MTKKAQRPRQNNQPTKPPITDTQAELLDRAIDVAIDRDRWRRIALADDEGATDSAQLAEIWKAKVADLEQQLAQAEHTLVLMLKESPDALAAITTWRRTRGPAELANTPTPALWADLTENR